jgi:hypothetical protein
MNGARLRALILGICAVAAVAAVVFAFARPTSRQPVVAAESRKPTLLLLSSLPLLFGDGFSLDGGGSPALSALRADYRIVPISVASSSELGQGDLLLMAQPLAQPAEDLVALDQWLRDGGHLLLLADPLLEWPSIRPLGDPLRPPPMFADTGLLGHWGLRLDAPDVRGMKASSLDGVPVLTASPGRIVGQGCATSADGLVARCRIGKGRATIVADADLLDVPELGTGASRNLDGVAKELAALETDSR